MTQNAEEARLPKTTLDALQHRAARCAIGPSSMRGAGNAGVIDAGREFLGSVALRPFGTSNSRAFRRALDDVTTGLQQSFPKSARHWGLARKGLNIFLRECLYTAYLRDEFRLGRGAAHFEIPLDSLTGKQIRNRSDAVAPVWKTIRGLTVELSDVYQHAASEIAQSMGIRRVHLDAHWWGSRKE